MDLKELEKAARAVTSQGKWHAVEGDEDDLWGITDTVGNAGTMSVAQMLWENDAKFIAAASPEVILELISLIRSQQELLRAYRTSTTNHGDCYKVDHNGVKRDFRCADCVKNDALLPPIEEK
jgi:hypothetical protein